MITRIDLARRLGVNPRTVAKFLEEGLPTARRGRGGRASLFDLVACQAWKTARDAKVEASGPGVAESRARRENAQAILAEQMFATRSRQLLPTAEVERVWQAEVARVRAAILGVYATQAERVHYASTSGGVRGVEDVLKTIAHELLKELEAVPPPPMQATA